MWWVQRELRCCRICLMLIWITASMEISKPPCSWLRSVCHTWRKPKVLRLLQLILCRKFKLFQQINLVLYDFALEEITSIFRKYCKHQQCFWNETSLGSPAICHVQGSSGSVHSLYITRSVQRCLCFAFYWYIFTASGKWSILHHLFIVQNWHLMALEWMQSVLEHSSHISTCGLGISLQSRNSLKW